MLTPIPLTDDERVEVDDGEGAPGLPPRPTRRHSHPVGATPPELGASPAPTFLPIIEVRRGESG